MSEDTSEILQPPKEETSVKVVGAIGLAEELLREEGSLKLPNSWMGISTKEKLYSDRMVIDFSKWASERCEKFLIVIADGLQAYNTLAFKQGGRGWGDIGTMMDEFVEPAKKRKEMLQRLIRKEELKNVEVKLWSQVIRELEQESEENDFLVNYGMQMFDHERQHNPEFEEELLNIVNQRIPDVLRRARKKGEKAFVDFSATSYPQEEIHLIWLLAVTGKYPVKIGPETERPYDEFTLNGIKGKYSALKFEGAQFGAVYLHRS